MQVKFFIYGRKGLIGEKTMGNTVESLLILCTNEGNFNLVIYSRKIKMR